MVVNVEEIVKTIIQVKGCKMRKISILHTGYSCSAKSFGSFSNKQKTKTKTKNQTKHMFTIWSSKYTFGPVSQRNEILSPHKNLYTDVHRNFFFGNSPKLETTKMF